MGSRYSSQVKPISGERTRNKKFRNPESKFFDTLKGKEVTLTLNLTEADLPIVVEATLLWVDRYSIGVKDHLGTERLIMKSVLATIEGSD